MALLLSVSATACVLGSQPGRRRANAWMIPIPRLVQPQRQAAAKPQRPLGSLQPGSSRFPMAFLGIRFHAPTSGPSELPHGSGVRVEEVIAGTSAASSGLQPGDVITELGGIGINSPEDLMLAVRLRDVGEEVELTFVRQGATFTIKLHLGSG